MSKARANRITGPGILAIAIMLLAGTLGWSGPAQASGAQAPEFTGISQWINSEPLTMKALRGKVVLIDFWAYSCINCLRTLPYVTRWYDTYKDKGLVVVGVHSPEFEFGKKRINIERAIKRFHIHYPVAMDSHMATWNAWHNRYWPAEYLVDRQGNVVLHHFGEGHYLDMENAIRTQLGLPPTEHAVTPGPDFTAIGSPEMYFGLERQQYLANGTDRFSPESEQPRDYQLPDRLSLNRFALGGHWKMTGQYAELTGDHGQIRLHFKSAKLYMVAASKQPVVLHITVDGHEQPPVTVSEDRLYTLFDSNDYHEHEITIDIPKAGLQAFTFTFG